MPNDRVIELNDLHWTFGSEVPALYSAEHRLTEKVDPFPCYAHDPDLVEASLEAVERAVDIDPKPNIFVLHYEPFNRTNGWADRGYGSYNDDEKRYTPAPGKIVLAGKRIPPHPAVTRYLVAHEYGHHVDYDICYRRKVDVDGFDDEYRQLRGLSEESRRYGGGYWHSNVGEFIANDFRILVAEVEPDYWPHPGFARPEEVKGLRQWWEEALSKT